MGLSMDNVNHQSAVPFPNVNWCAAFQSEEFCATSEKAVNEGHGASAASMLSNLHAPSFMNISESTSMPSILSLKICWPSLVATTNASQRKKTGASDVLSWVECFTSYMAVMTASYPSRAGDLLAYMALIFRIAKQFLGR